jgi:hypothetical protein
MPSPAGCQLLCQRCIKLSFISWLMLLCAELLTLHDDVVRITPSQQKVTLDVLKNDNLGGSDPADISIIIIAPGPAAGSAAVLPAAVASSSSSSSSRQQIQFSLSDAPLVPGQSLTFFYSVAVPGHPAPAPAAVTLIGAGEQCDVLCGMHVMACQGGVQWVLCWHT